MELSITRQIPFEDISHVSYDYFIVASGYESRCTYLAQQMLPIDTHKYVIAFKDKRKMLYRPYNDQWFKENDFTFFQAPSYDEKQIISILDKIFDNKNKSCLNVLVDYSCMTKKCQSAFVNYFLSRDFLCHNVTLYFSYTPSKFSEPKKGKGSLHLLSKKISHGPRSEKPSVLVFGLGYEKDLALHVVKSYKPDITYAFYAEPINDPRYLNAVKKGNLELLEQLNENNIIPYPLEDQKVIDNLLSSLILKLRLTHKVILVPLGPKPFTLACLLLSAKYPDVEIWNLNTTKNKKLYEREPFGEPLIYQATFCKDDLDY